MSAPCPTFGFSVHLEVESHANPARLVSAFLHEAVEHRGLRCVARGTRTLEWVIAGDGIQATDADREAVLSWLGTQSGLAAFSVGPLADVGSEA